jgi:hypothetical protein
VLHRCCLLFPGSDILNITILNTAESWLIKVKVIRKL